MLAVKLLDKGFLNMELMTAIWQTIYKSAWIVLYILAFILVLRLFYPKYKQYCEYQEIKQLLIAEIETKEKMVKMLRMKQERFRGDPRFVEQEAHKLGLAKPDEFIFKIIEPEKPAQSPPEDEEGEDRDR